jgi:predicted MFS family arabinose efflux permease
LGEGARRGLLAVALWSMLAITADIGLARLGYGLVLPAIRADMAGSFAAFGFVATLHFVGYLLGSLAAPLILRRDTGARASATWAHVVVALTLAGSAVATTLPAFAVARTIMGFACGLGVAAVITGALGRALPRDRAAVSGYAWSGIAVGLFLSAPASPWLLGGPDRWREATMIVAAIALITAAGLWRAFSGGAAQAPSTGIAETPFRIADVRDPRRYLFLSLAYFGFGAAYTAYATFIVAALRTLHFSTLSIAIVWTALGVTALIGALSVGRIVAGRLGFIALALALGIAALGSLLATVPSTAAAIAGALGVGLGLASTPAIASAIARRRSSAATGAAAFVAITTIMSIGQVLGPVVAGAAADRFGPPVVPLVAFAIYAAGAVFALIDGVIERRAQPA